MLRYMTVILTLVLQLIFSARTANTALSKMFLRQKSQPTIHVKSRYWTNSRKRNGPLWLRCNSFSTSLSPAVKGSVLAASSQSCSFFGRGTPVISVPRESA